MLGYLRAAIYYRLGLWARYVGLRTSERRHFRQAEAHFSRALRAAPDHWQARQARGVLRWRELDDFNGAIQDFTAVLAVRPHHQLALFCRSMAHWRGGNYLAAIDDLEKVIQIDAATRTTQDALAQLQALYDIAEELPQVRQRLDQSPVIMLDAPDRPEASADDE